MIAASEPLEFIPRGRQAVEEHPGPSEPKPHCELSAEHVLLHRMQNVNLSEEEEKDNEFWCIRELYKDCFESKVQKQLLKKLRDIVNNKDKRKSIDEIHKNYTCDDYMCDYLVNTEEELYFKNCTAVWTRGVISENGAKLQPLCLTCDTRIKFGFFCNKSFVRTRDELIKAELNDDDDFKTICLIDSQALRVYCSNGEDFLTNLEFPVSQIWLTKYCVLLEKIASNITIQNHTIPMPRLFSLTHPLDEICPVANKTETNNVNYLTESDIKIVFTAENSDLILLYDARFGKHILSKIRKVTDEEINAVGTQNEQAAGVHQSLNRGTVNTAPGCSFSQNPKVLGATPKVRNSVGNSIYNTHIGKFLSGSQVGLSRNPSGTHLNNLQSTVSQHSLSIQDMRKMGQPQPSKPIVPEYCLQHLWTENLYASGERNINEMATKGFLHTDLIHQTYFCYLLPVSCKLFLIRLQNYGEDNLQISTTIQTIPAKDAAVLHQMNMIVVLDPGGFIILYTGNTFISKVHITTPPLHNLSNISSGSSATTITTNITMPISVPMMPTAASMTPTTPFPKIKRSSLLPSAQADTDFDDELHLLSPVPGLQQNSMTHHTNMALRDPAGNRVTLIYPCGKMYRISLPLMCENRFITQCIHTLRQILVQDLFLQFLIRWYVVRNPPGSCDFTGKQEWDLFESLLLDMMGCSIRSPDLNSHIISSFNVEEPKKRRQDDDMIAGTTDDWYFLMYVLSREGLNYDKYSSPTRTFDMKAPFFHMIPAIFYSFHLLYEDAKLDQGRLNSAQRLAWLLHQLSLSLQLQPYILHYCLDFPDLAKKSLNVPLFNAEHAMLMQYKTLLELPTPNVLQHVQDILKGKETGSKYLYVQGVCDLSRNVLQIISLIMHGFDKMKNWINPIVFPNAVQLNFPKRTQRFISTTGTRSHQVVEMMLEMGMSRQDVERLPMALQLIISECLELSRLTPPIGCSADTYELILRSELVEHTKLPYETKKKTQMSTVHAEDSLSPRCPLTTSSIAHIETTPDDGMDNIDTKLMSLRFPDDMRIVEVRRILKSSEPVLIDITQSPGISDHEFIEEQEKQLFTLSTRTMTLPMGRAMLTMRTAQQKPTESVPIPKLCLSGKEPIKGAAIEMQQIEIPPNMNLWPTFHNGVAAGLKIACNASDIDSTWIVYNKPKATESSTEHAGFLMALGLNGSLKNLSFMSLYEYLVKCDEMTSVGLLLGLSATHRGTMNNTTTKLLSVHIEALLPATALELDIPQNLQVAAIMGVGLLYQGTAKRHIAEVLLQEVGRPPGPEMENCIERESYALTAGLALGLVTLGQGESPAGLRDLQVPDTLHYYMVGGSKRPLTGSQKEKYKLTSFQVSEGDTVNIDVTAPGATIALGLMFFNTNNHAIAEWMNPPNTRYVLDLVRPDFLLLRTLARGLIMWSEIEPTEEWLFSQFPESLRFDYDRSSTDPTINENIDNESITQAFCNIIAGASFCIGLKYAGTSNATAFKTLRRIIKMFMSLNGKYIGEYAGRSTIENSLLVILISISLVFAGSGDLEILRIIRYLRSRIGPQFPHVTYGSHMAIHMSLGLLFLGAGRFTIAKTPEAIAALICAFYPKFPNHSNDNRYHLQAFRHLYVLAVEPRLFIPRDIDTKKLCLCKIAVLDNHSDMLRELPMAPCILPSLDTIQKVIVQDDSYWPVSFERGHNWDLLVNALQNCSCIDIKKRSGCLSHIEDPDRLKSLFSQTLTAEQYVCWEVDPEALERFSNEPYVIAFTDRLLHLDTDTALKNEKQYQKCLTLSFYNAVVKDKMHVLPIYLQLLDCIRFLHNGVRCDEVHQVRIMELYLEHYKEENVLISRELITASVDRFRYYIENAVEELADYVKNFLRSNTFTNQLFADLSDIRISHFLNIIVYYELSLNMLNLIHFNGPLNYINCLIEFNKLNLDPHMILGLIKIMVRNE